MMRILALLLLLSRVGWCQPVFLPAGAEGLDLKSYDLKTRAPLLSLAQGVATLEVPRLKPERLPRSLRRAEFRSVGEMALNVMEGDEAREYYCPSRLIKALKMDEWLSGTGIVMGVYAGYEGKPAVVSLMSDSWNGKSVPAGWIPLSKPEANEQIWRLPLGDSFVCLVSAREERVFFAGQPGQATPKEGLTVYEQAGSEWRVACQRQGDWLQLLVAPAQDFPVLLESLEIFSGSIRRDHG